MYSLAQEKEQQRELIRRTAQIPEFPENHMNYLWQLKADGFEPRVIYDIGACVLHWSRAAKEVWPEATIIIFEANSDLAFLYEEQGLSGSYYMGLLGNEDGNRVKFYQSKTNMTGNSYYREVGFDGGKYYPPEQYVMKTMYTLDTVVEENGFPKPDFVKMDVQGAEMDIVRGGTKTLSHAQHLILELQTTNYNDGAPKAAEVLPEMEELGWECVAPLFQDYGPDGDYGFARCK